MIVGVGMDIIEVSRVREAVEKNPRFIERIFTEREIRYSLAKKNKYQHLAARFAAKEAFFKALGKRISWAEVEIINQVSGKPELVIHSNESFSFNRALVSLVHLKEYAAAIVTLEKD